MKARLESISFSIDTILQDIPHYSSRKQKNIVLSYRIKFYKRRYTLAKMYNARMCVPSRTSRRPEGLDNDCLKQTMMFVLRRVLLTKAYQSKVIFPVLTTKTLCIIEMLKNGRYISFETTF